ncbi:ATP-binding protein [Octadecabacter sp. 1_MG-2023]|uniref:ATP-binding protein n=1 Tax=unclassified Octadecabacter TaxID=196158 RepID=UPI001C0A510D|nr:MULTISPECIES: ATP-binding protein [unclassified Octadecabacter]MBU2993948.1 ATP-binding protein [Octadecabacter sp. B2R22]MDO6735206.1 ATP-binding protein [Octadecabacter sp. 1_MG-2023]
MTIRTIEAGPSKRFFVEMLPRDISLEYAVLDLIDNSLDGAIRQRIDDIRLRRGEPYKGLHCKLSFSETEFQITDNCGGIPADRIDAALKLGRDDPNIDNDKPTIGMYGIGMKRSIFKISADSTVVSKSDTITTRVNYDETWMNPENPDWTLDLEETPPDGGELGVTISANKLWPNISRTFASQSFFDDLTRKISRYYAYVIAKGFKIFVNDKEIPALPVEFKLDDAVISPFYYEAVAEKVNVKVIVGLFRKLTKEDEREEAISSNDGLEAGDLKAGITVVCNDRVITYADTSSVTGWGMGNVPRYHPQFRSITGIIIFESDDARTLPVSTTKGALDLDDRAYVVGLNAAMEGIKTHTDYTNRTKGRESATDTPIQSAPKLSIAQVTQSLSSSARAVRHSNGKARKVVPTLPEIKRTAPIGRIAFSRDKAEIERVAELLGLSTSEKPGVVGEQVWTDLARKLGVID